ncbi:hypothetical protein SLEP1_g37395 [Rubroshorea leprosula]|uniref:Uncharacterized protein n=1 Tax=Rubroshorea leprosula TaxID=152421 RepID=A0AAV5KUF2_9ROSI|nr:hypothetical protein SLEP1_g37395 [Rubroshorea leprosula]
MELNFAMKGMQISRLVVPQKPASSLFMVYLGCNQPSYSHLVYRTNLCHGSKLGSYRFKLACSARDNHNPDEELTRSEELARRFSFINDVDENFKETTCRVSESSGDFRSKEGENGTKVDFSMKLLPSKIEVLEPNILGISLEPPDWPGRDDIEKIDIEQKANRVDIPLSLRMIKKKQKWQEGFVDAGEFTYCSLKKAFSSLVSSIEEIQNNALQLHGSLYSEDLHGIMNKVQREMNNSFVWLFQQVFSRTPTLMVYVMILLANFTTNSMADNVAAAVVLSSPSETIAETIPFTEEYCGGKSKSDCSTSVQYPSIVSPDKLLEGSRGMTAEEVGLWNSTVEVALRMRGESDDKVLDYQMMRQFVTQINVELEPDDYEEYYRTDLLYQMSLAEEPNNQLLLLNYGQFLHLVSKDHDRAEECFKRAIQIEPPDAVALTQYADFLWKVRNDLWEAEERYQQAMAAEPDNPYHASKYANFLWSTGGEDTCFPLSGSFENCDKFSRSNGDNT